MRIDSLETSSMWIASLTSEEISQINPAELSKPVFWAIIDRMKDIKYEEGSATEGYQNLIQHRFENCLAIERFEKNLDV